MRSTAACDAILPWRPGGLRGWRAEAPLQQVRGQEGGRLAGVGVLTPVAAGLGRDRGPVREGEMVQGRLCVTVEECWRTGDGDTVRHRKTQKCIGNSDQ